MYSKYDRLLSFASVHYAIRAENILKQAGIDVIAVPTPREIDISCGQCLLFAADCQQQVLTLLQEKQVQWSKLLSRDGQRRVYELISQS